MRNDPLVVASYLGTDERAIARSDGGTTRGAAAAALTSGATTSEAEDRSVRAQEIP